MRGAVDDGSVAVEVAVVQDGLAVIITVERWTERGVRREDDAKRRRLPLRRDVSTECGRGGCVTIGRFPARGRLYMIIIVVVVITFLSRPPPLAAVLHDYFFYQFYSLSRLFSCANYYCSYSSLYTI